MNILLQVAGFCVMIVIFIFYFNDRKSAVKQNRLYLYQSFAIFTSLTLDIISIVLINTPGWTYSILTYAICRTYLISCLLVVYFGLLYVLGDLNEIRKSKIDLIKYAALAVLVINSIFIYALPLEIVYDPEGLNDFTAGIPIILTYGGTFLFMALTLGIAFANRKIMYHKRFKAVVIFISVWVFGSGIQALFNYVLSDLGIVILSVSFTETLGSLAIYIMLENPAFNVDRVTGALTHRAFEDYLNTCYRKNIDIEFFLVDYDSAIASQTIGYNKLARSLTMQFNEYKAFKVFKNDKNNFIIVRKKDYSKPLTELIEGFKKELYLRNNMVTEIPFKIFYFNDVHLMYDTLDCLNVISHLIQNMNKFNDQITFVSKEIVDDIHQIFEIQKKSDIAFMKKKIEVYLQPIYSNSELSFTAAEALVRLIDDEGNLIYPANFIETMEADGRIIELGRIVFEDVCKFISENNMEELKLKYIEVNLSAVQCMQEDLASSYIEIMEKYKIDPKYINLEITETAQSTKSILLKNMAKLKEYGVSFSLDDFGTGNSNLNYVIEMPVEIVKFDRSMVNSYFENKIASFVMNSAINMVKGLGHKIVFEGIQEQEQIELIKDLDVDYIQGYFYSRPINKEDFINFIRTNN